MSLDETGGVDPGGSTDAGAVQEAERASPGNTTGNTTSDGRTATDRATDGAVVQEALGSDPGQAVLGAVADQVGGEAEAEPALAPAQAATPAADAPSPDPDAPFEPTPPPDGFVQRMREGAASSVGRTVGEAQAIGGWAGDMVGGAAAAVETGYEAAVSGIEAATGLIPDEHAQRQRDDLTARAEGLRAAAEEVLSDPEGVARAFAESFEARYAQADALEGAYRSGHADLSAYREAERIRGEADTELAILGVETGAVALGGAGAIAKGLRAARVADKLDGATPLAIAMAGAERARAGTAEIADLVRQPGRTEPFNAATVAERVRDVESGARRGHLDAYQWDAAEVVYGEIRSIDAAVDVRRIAQNTGLPEADVALAREHVFMDLHELDGGTKRFDADPYMANAWQRLQDGTFTDNDLALIEHERYEAGLMRDEGMSYREAHIATETTGRVWSYEP